MSDNTHALHSEDGHGGHHITSISDYGKVLLILLVLMGATVGASYVSFDGYLGPALGSVANNVIAMTIAIVKAACVVWVFMGIRHSTKLTKMFAYMGFIWFLLMFIMLADYWTRPWETVRGWETPKPSAMSRDRKGEELEHSDIGEKRLR